MAMLPLHPKQDNTIQIFYIDTNFSIKSKAFFVNRKRYLNWKDLRYNLETDHGSFVNNRTYLIGYTPEKVILQPNDDLPQVIYIHRNVMPTGYQQFVPCTSFQNYIIAHEKHKNLLEQKTAMENELLKTDMLADYSNFSSVQSLQEEYINQIEILNTKLLKLQETIEYYLRKEGVHASEAKKHSIEVSKYENVSHVVDIAIPHQEYTCSDCLQKGSHFKDDCFRFEKKATSATFKFGAAKMKPLESSVCTNGWSKNIGSSQNSC